MSIRLPADAARASQLEGRKPLFVTAGGWLTRYALACGYIQQRGSGDQEVKLRQLPCGGAFEVFHRQGWTRQSFTRLQEARRAFKQL
jgi:hypothetical protein